jgi:hypothetical protein
VINIEDAREKLHGAISFSITVYSFCYGQIPSNDALEEGVVEVGHVPFQNTYHAGAYANELGWAFFVRIEAALDALANRLGINKRQLFAIVQNANELNENEKQEFYAALELRNILHHGDGDHQLLRNDVQFYAAVDGEEPRINAEYLYKCVDLFLKVGDILVKHAVDNQA